MRTYIYPENLSAKATLWMWTLRDMGIIAAGLILSVLAITTIRFPLPLVGICAYAFLSIQLDDVSIKDYISWAWRFLVSGQQYFIWEQAEPVPIARKDCNNHAKTPAMKGVKI